MARPGARIPELGERVQMSKYATAFRGVWGKVVKIEFNPPPTRVLGKKRIIEDRIVPGASVQRKARDDKGVSLRTRRRGTGRQTYLGEGVKMVNAKQDDKKVKLDFESSHLYSEWTYTVEGDSYVIENGGTEVPAGRADKLIEASRKTEARLVKRS